MQGAVLGAGASSIGASLLAGSPPGAVLGAGRPSTKPPLVCPPVAHKDVVQEFGEPFWHGARYHGYGKGPRGPTYE